jgi:methionyl-tRNA formyltransferase
MRIVFMGSPAFGLPALRWLAAAHEVVGVVTQPDRPAGRGRKLAAPPVKALALELGLPTIQPSRLRDATGMDQLRAWNPELIVVAAFGQILRPEVLQLPARGCVNLHASLLPRHRGAAPIPAAILAGDAETGITLMRMDEGVDTGPILAQEKLIVVADDTSLTLAAKLAELAGKTAERHLPSFSRGELPERPQPDAGATYAPPLRKADGRLDFTLSAITLERRVRAFNPWPGTYAIWQGEPLKVLRAQPLAASGAPRAIPGTVFHHPEGMGATCGEGALLLVEVQPSGKRPMPGEAFLRGAPAIVGSVLE